MITDKDLLQRCIVAGLRRQGHDAERLEEVILGTSVKLRRTINASQRNATPPPEMYLISTSDKIYGTEVYGRWNCLDEFIGFCPIIQNSARLFANFTIPNAVLVAPIIAAATFADEIVLPGFDRIHPTMLRLRPSFPR